MAAVNAGDVEHTRASQTHTSELMKRWSTLTMDPSLQGRADTQTDPDTLPVDLYA